MKGFVDDKLRALLRVPVSASRDGDRKEILVWIDTAFNGGLVIPNRQIAELGLAQESSAEAILAEKRVDEAVIAEAVQAAMDGCKPISDTRGSAVYRKQMVRNLTRTALLDVWAKIP